MASQSSFTSGITKLDPTQGLVRFVADTKPYHTKVLDVLVEYVYSEQVSVSFLEDIKWQFIFDRPVVDLVRTCGYGYTWDDTIGGATHDNTSARVNIIAANAAIESPGAGFELSNSFLVDPHTFEAIPSAVTYVSNNQLLFSKEFWIVGKNDVAGTWDVADPLGVVYETLSLGSFPKSVYISSDTSGLGSGKYDVLSAPTTSSGITTITVAGGVPLQANANGILHLPRSAYEFDVVGVSVGLGGVWIIPGNVASLFPSGRKFSVVGNTGITDRVFTVVSSTNVGVNTNLVVSAIDSAATVTGKVKFSELPQWQPGTAVTVSLTTNTLPTPLALSATYYFQPTVLPGYFTLAYKRHPSRLEDYVNLIDYGVGSFEIVRTETFVPGEPIYVDGSYNGRNNGRYTVKYTQQEGSYERVFVYEKVDTTTPLTLSFDGVITPDIAGLGGSAYCPPSQMGDAHTDAFIHEKISFTFEINLADFMVASYAENAPKGYGETPFGMHVFSPYGAYTANIPLAVTSGLPPIDSAHMILPTGIDTQLFDVGAIDETLEYATKQQMNT